MTSGVDKWIQRRASDNLRTEEEASWQRVRGRWDQDRDVTSRAGAESWINILERIIIEDKTLPKPTGPFLGLAAGKGIAELGVASKLGINLQQTILVDKKIEPDFVGVAQYKEDDVFNFLENWTGDKFGFVTLFGAEYIFLNERNEFSQETWRRFWNGVAKVTKSGAYVLVMRDDDVNSPPNTPFRLIKGGTSDITVLRT